MSYSGAMGQFNPSMIGIVYDVTATAWEIKRVESLVDDFPSVFERALVDFAKFKIGVEHGLFSETEIVEVKSWYLEFPELWEAIRLNFIQTDPGREFGGRVDDFVGRIRKADRGGQLGIVVSTVLIGSVLLVGGLASGLWAYGYIQKQQNMSDMISEVVAGNLPADVLSEAIAAEQDVGLFSGLTTALGPVMFAVAAYVVYMATKK